MAWLLQWMSGVAVCKILPLKDRYSHFYGSKFFKVNFYKVLCTNLKWKSNIVLQKISFGLGTCLPDACSVKDTNNIFRAVFYEGMTLLLKHAMSLDWVENIIFVIFYIARKYTGDRINIESSMCHEKPTYSTGSKVTM